MAGPASLLHASVLASRSLAFRPTTHVAPIRFTSSANHSIGRQANSASFCPAKKDHSPRKSLQIVAARTESADFPLGDTIPDFQLAKDIKSHGIETIGISSNSVITHPQDGPEEMAEDAQNFGYPFRYLYNESQEVARAYKAACTPEFYLADANLKLFYHGQFDESRPSNGVLVTGNDVKSAIDSLLKREALMQPVRPSMGCGIKWHPAKQVA